MGLCHDSCIWENGMTDSNQSCHIPIRKSYVFVAWLAAREIKTCVIHVHTHIHDENATHSIYQRDIFKQYVMSHFNE